MTHLRRYAKYITVGLQNESAKEYADWKKRMTDDYAENAALIKTLERPEDWNELFGAMGELDFTQADVNIHCSELEAAGEHALVNAVRQAADSEPNFRHMEHG